MRWDFWRLKHHEVDLDDEIAHDLALDAEERILSGDTPREAELAARRDFGNVGLLKEGVREMWGWTSLERLARDFRYGWRTLRRSPLFTGMAVLSLALGISGSPLFVSPWWLAFTAFVGANLLQSALTKWCLMETILRRLGARAGC